MIIKHFSQLWEDYNWALETSLSGGCVNNLAKLI